MNDRLSFEGLHEFYPPFADKQQGPKPGQIMNVAEIEVGGRYAAVNLRWRSVEMLTVTELPSADDKGHLWLKATYLDPVGDPAEKKISMSDYGIVPYEDGSWGISNVLVRPSYLNQVLRRKRR